MQPGLVTRTEILEHLDSETWISASEIAENIDVTYSTVLYHLKNMAKENVVTCEDEGSGWKLCKTGQTTLLEHGE